MLQVTQALYGRIVLGAGDDVSKEEAKATKARTKSDRWSEFVHALQGWLNKNLGPQWHVIAGESLAFACKNRLKAMAQFRVDKLIIIAWRSPGREEVQPEEAADAQAEEVENEAKPPKWKVLHPKDLPPEDEDQGDDPRKTISILRRAMLSTKLKEQEDSAEVAREIRRRLTAELGTIWHVAVGNDFVTAPAGNVRNFVRVSVKNLEIACFQHEQKEADRIDHEKILKALPYLLLVLFCFTFLTMQSVCGDEAPSADRKFALMLRRRLCQEDWEWKVQALGGAALVALFVSKKLPAFLGKFNGK